MRTTSVTMPSTAKVKCFSPPSPTCRAEQSRAEWTELEWSGGEGIIYSTVCTRRAAGLISPPYHFVHCLTHESCPLHSAPVRQRLGECVSRESERLCSSSSSSPSSLDVLFFLLHRVLIPIFGCCCFCLF